MENKLIVNRALLIIYLLNLFLLIETQVDEDLTMRAYSCMNIFNKKFTGTAEPKPPLNSPAMLACFLKINEDQSQSVLSSIDSEELPLEPQEIEQLFNTDILNEISEDEMKQKTEELEMALKDIQKFDDYENKENFDDYNDYDKYGDYGDYGDYGEGMGDYDENNYNYNYDNNDDEKSWKFKECFDENKGLWIGIFVCVVVFILIVIFGKPYDESLDLDKNKSE